MDFTKEAEVLAVDDDLRTAAFQETGMRAFFHFSIEAQSQQQGIQHLPHFCEVGFVMAYSNSKMFPLSDARFGAGIFRERSPDLKEILRIFMALVFRQVFHEAWEQPVQQVVVLAERVL